MSELVHRLRKIGNKVGIKNRMADMATGLEAARHIEELEKAVVHLQIELGKESIRMAHMRHQMNKKENNK